MSRRPLNGLPPITQVYGVRNSVYRKGYHTGVDYGVGTGTPIYAPANGRIESGDGRAAGDGRGYFIIIYGDDGVSHHLYHMRDRTYHSGRIAEGQEIGYTGNTGMSTGPHLHWETRRNNNDFNPADWLFAPVPTPPAQTGDYMTPMTADREAQLYVQYLGRTKEFAGASGRSEQKWFADAQPEIISNINARKVLEGQVANLSGQIQNIQKQVDDLSKRPTQAQLDELKQVTEKATTQAEKDRLKAEELQKQVTQYEGERQQDTATGNSFLRWLGNLLRKGQ